MSQEQFGNADAYARPFEALRRERIPEKHIDLLLAHFKAPKHTATWSQLAEVVGYASGRAINLQYGTLAGRVARQLGLVEPPEGWWLFVLVDWAKKKDRSGHEAFVLRRPVIEALTRIGLFPASQ